MATDPRPFQHSSGNTPVFTHYARKRLNETALFCHQQPAHSWRERALREDLTNNLYLMRELYRIAGGNPRIVNRLLDYAGVYLHCKIESFGRGERYIDPTHPNIMNNPNHPLNPSNRLNLELNPALNLLFQQEEAERKMAQENDQEEKTEEEKSENQLTNLNETSLKNTDINPYQVLNVKPEDKHDIIELACMTQLEKHAPKHDEAPSAHYEKLAAATAMIGTVQGHTKYKEIFNQLKEVGKHHTPELRPPTGKVHEEERA